MADHALAICALDGPTKGRILYGVSGDPIPFGWPRLTGIEGRLEPEQDRREGGPSAFYFRAGERHFKILARPDLPTAQVLELEGETPAAPPALAVGWRSPAVAPPPAKPTPEVIGHDPLRGPILQDEREMRNVEQRVIDGSRGWVTQPTPEQARLRQLRYLRDFVPEQWAAILEKPQADPLVQQILAESAAPGAGSHFVAESEEVTSPPPAPAPAEPPPTDDLDQLLAEEEQLEAAGDAVRLAEVRARIEQAVK